MPSAPPAKVPAGTTASRISAHTVSSLLLPCVRLSVSVSVSMVLGWLVAGWVLTHRSIKVD
eukprot:SAG11_NODE_27993_length_326_cov_1.295154_1_plen_60_part_10